MRYIIFILALIITGCTNQNKPTTDEVTELAMMEGDKISMMAQKALGSQLKKAIIEDGPTYAVQFCNIAAYPILDTLKTDLNISIRRASLRVRNLKNEPTDSERKILEKYDDQLNNGSQVTSVVEVLNDKQVLYAKPIILDNPICLNCHGQVGPHVSAETHNLIKNLYPQDNAINHKIGDLRGIWSIIFDRDELAKAFQERD
jgi:hypothetical protein